MIGHLRYLLEAVGPELRQYIVTGNDEERPFSRNERRWVYATAKRQNPHFGFGSDVDWATHPGHVLVRHAAFPAAAPGDGEPLGWPLPCAKVLGAANGRPRLPPALGGERLRHELRRPRRARRRGDRPGLRARRLPAEHRGGRAEPPPHLHGADLVFQIGTAYFGCRDARGRFSLPALVELVEANPVRAIEVKLSQGAKPGVDALLPAAKVTPEIAAARGVPAGVDCRSPAAHSAFSDVPGLIGFVERVAEATGLPVTIKAAVGELGFWRDLARRMARDGAGPDGVTIDGGEGGTGAGPLVFTDHVALPFRLGLGSVYPIFAEEGLAERVVFTGSGKLGLPENALLAFAMGCDTVSVGREAMMAVGCIQAQRCHTGRCPTGVATQSAWLQRGLVPEHAGERLAHYVAGLRAELLRLARACGVAHPALVTPDRIELLDGERIVSAAERFGYRPGWGLPGEADRAALAGLMREQARERPEAPPQRIPTRPGEVPRVP